MKYDDVEQNLHINLKPGVQVLNGKDAEGIVRFRKNNDGTGYARGDLQRVEMQQKFIKSLISTTLNTKNITKIPDLANIVLNNSNTNVTIREALRYTTDLNNLKLDEIYATTAPNTTADIGGLSYVKLNKEKIKEEMDLHFNLEEVVEQQK